MSLTIETARDLGLNGCEYCGHCKDCSRERNLPRPVMRSVYRALREPGPLSTVRVCRELGLELTQTITAVTLRINHSTSYTVTPAQVKHALLSFWCAQAIRHLNNGTTLVRL